MVNVVLVNVVLEFRDWMMTDASMLLPQPGMPHSHRNELGEAPQSRNLLEIRTHWPELFCFHCAMNR
jgi:hypothetical protein